MKPIVFSTAMVEAILAGRKTQTRRIVKPQPRVEPDWSCEGVDGLTFFKRNGEELSTTAIDMLDVYANCEPENMGFAYQPGDVLWVREKLVKGYAWGGAIPFIYYENEVPVLKEDAKEKPNALKEVSNFIEWPWKRDTLPSIFMPRYAARIFLEVEAVRVERLGDIGFAGCIAEGIETEHSPGRGKSVEQLRSSFQSLWNSLHGKGAWDLNPWVFVYEFRRP